MKTKQRKFKKKKSDNRNRSFGPKNEKEIIKQIGALAEPLCDSEGLELVHIEFQRESGGRILRLYIDQPAGVSLDDCVNVSRQLNDLLDVKLDDIGPYTLEVTSPGPERPLSKLKDYERFKGRKAKIKTQLPINEQRNFTGVIVGTSAEQIKLLFNEKTVDIPFGYIAKARLVDADGEI
ncbi:MAG: ribosome maturation factor RimP [Desulfobacterales bacterium]|nr:ribosome maturation factor RimP [Desulfobacterales bacterium]